MLELLHGNKDKNKEFDEFEEQNVNIVDQQIEQEDALNSARSKGSRLEGIVNTVLLSDGRTKEISGSSLALNGNLTANKGSISSAPLKQRKKFGWVEGVFFRCVLNIFGVILYLRVSWVIFF